MEEIDLLEQIKFLIFCKNDQQAIRLIEKYGFCKKQEGINQKVSTDGMDGVDVWVTHKIITSNKNDKIPNGINSFGDNQEAGI